MQYWLMKSEPSTYSMNSLTIAQDQQGYWEGVRNYQARNFIKNDMKPGDLAFFYHSSCKNPGIMGIITLLSHGTPDPDALDPQSPYFDPKSTPENPIWYGVHFQLKARWHSPLLLSDLKACPTLHDMQLLQKGNRLSVFPITPAHWRCIIALHTATISAPDSAESF